MTLKFSTNENQRDLDQIALIKRNTKFFTPTVVNFPCVPFRSFKIVSASFPERFLF